MMPIEVSQLERHCVTDRGDTDRGDVVQVTASGHKPLDEFPTPR